MRRCLRSRARRRLPACDHGRGRHPALCRVVPRLPWDARSRRRHGGAVTGRIIPLVMCGGAGTRLWPASREGRPKQFMPLMGSRSTFQETVLRVGDPSVFGRPIIITNGAYRFLVAEQLAAIGVEADIVLEPARRDSGPAIAAGAAFARARDGDTAMIALAADHVVSDAVTFVGACKAGGEAAAQGRIVTFGVRPTRPATEYGYIRP